MQQFLLEQAKFGGGRVTRGKASGRATPKAYKSKKKRKSTDGVEEGKKEGEEEGEEPKKKKKKAAPRVNKPKNLSPALAEVLGEPSMTRPDVVKKLHEYFKAHNLQNPKNKKQIIFDEKLQLVFKRKTTDYFALNTLLTKHLTDPGELVE
jgi:upstream activation factor subunit UAF30